MTYDNNHEGYINFGPNYIGLVLSDVICVKFLKLIIIMDNE